MSDKHEEVRPVATPRQMPAKISVPSTGPSENQQVPSPASMKPKIAPPAVKSDSASPTPDNSEDARQLPIHPAASRNSESAYHARKRRYVDSLDRELALQGKREFFAEVVRVSYKPDGYATGIVMRLTENAPQNALLPRASLDSIADWFIGDVEEKVAQAEAENGTVSFLVELDRADALAEQPRLMVKLPLERRAQIEQMLLCGYESFDLFSGKPHLLERNGAAFAISVKGNARGMLHVSQVEGGEEKLRELANQPLVQTTVLYVDPARNRLQLALRTPEQVKAIYDSKVDDVVEGRTELIENDGTPFAVAVRNEYVEGRVHISQVPGGVEQLKQLAQAETLVTRVIGIDEQKSFLRLALCDES